MSEFAIKWLCGAALILGGASAVILYFWGINWLLDRMLRPSPLVSRPRQEPRPEPVPVWFYY